MIQMIKVKSRSRDMRESAEQLTRYAINKRSHSKENRMAQTADHRNFSNQYLPPTHHFDAHLQSLKSREYSSSKNCRKDLKGVMEVQGQGQRSPYEGKERRLQSRNFIGSKLKKKLQKYLLFLSLVNYSLRVSYQRADTRKYKIFVGKGNNSKLVRTLFANRFWWELAQDETDAHLVWTQRAKKKVFRTMGDMCEQKQQVYVVEGLAPRKLKCKRKEAKRHCEEFESLLCEKDKQMVRAECRREGFEDDLRIFLRKWKQEKRKAIKLTHNHIENHRLLTNKKNLFLNLRQFCQQHNDNIFNYVPLTFHIRNNAEEEYQCLLRYQENQGKREKEKLLWIVKPGQNSNRGCGIQICRRVEQVRKHVQRCLLKHPQRTFIVQKYISPFLFHRRKFDIRCFVLVTATPLVSAYFYPHGYIRTSSFPFSLKNCSNKYIHLTNDAIQKKASEYSKYESGNKVTFEAFQQYLELFHQHAQVNFFTDILPLMRELVLLSIKSANNFHNSSKEHTFEVLGYDFMLDEELQPWLIEINTNPCLETGCEVLDAIIPSMLENAIKIAVDPIFKPPKMEEWSMKELLGCSERLLESNRFELIYSQLHDE